jgi:hypothetical protein
MAYSTGTVATKTALFDAIDTFLTSNGWSLYDTVSSTSDQKDKVYRSAGTVAGRPYIYLRVRETRNEQIRDYVDWPMTGIHFMGYRGWTIGNAAAAVGEFGLLKEWRGFRSSSSAVEAYSLPYQGNNANPPTVRSTDLQGITGADQAPSRNHQTHIAGRRMVRVSRGGVNHAVAIFDNALQTGQGNFGGFDPVNGAQGTALVTDKTTGVEYLYGMLPSGTNKSFGRLTLAGPGGQVYLTDPPWGGAVAHANSQCIWDGDDTIYVLRGDATASFAKYSISGGTWTTLTSAPAVVSASATMLRPFIWKNAISGLGQDRLYFASWGTTWYYYNVTDNAWSNGTTLPHPTAMPVSSVFSAANTGLVGDFDGDYLWCRVSQVNNMTVGGDTLYIYTPATAGAGSWTTNASRLWWPAANEGYALDFLVHPLGWVPCPTTGGPVGYWLVGDADSVTLAVRIPGGNNAGNQNFYWWAHAGFVDTAFDNLLRSTTGSVSPGLNVAIPVTGSPPLPWAAGDKVQIIDTATNAAELCTVGSVSGTTVTLQQVAFSYSAGAAIGRDPLPFVITSNYRIGALTTSSNRYRSGGYYDWYRVCSPNTGSEINIIAQNRMGYRLWPMEIHNFEQNNMPDTYEMRGRLKNIFSIKAGLNNEDRLTVEGNQYIVLYDYYTKNQFTTGAWDARGVAIGPLV